MQLTNLVVNRTRDNIAKAFGVDIEKANVGDTKVGKDGVTRVYVQLPSGKYDWRRVKKNKEESKEEEPKKKYSDIDFKKFTSTYGGYTSYNTVVGDVYLSILKKNSKYYIGINENYDLSSKGELSFDSVEEARDKLLGILEQRRPEAFKVNAEMKKEYQGVTFKLKNNGRLFYYEGKLGNLELGIHRTLVASWEIVINGEFLRPNIFAEAYDFDSVEKARNMLVKEAKNRIKVEESKANLNHNK